MSLYLVTGAAGFIGSNLVHALLAHGQRVRGIDNFATGRKENLEGASGLELMEGDITDPATMRTAMRDVEFVLHQAAIPSVPRSIEEPVRSHEANATGTLRVLEAARSAGSVRRVVYASSSSAYGDTEELPKHEQMRPQPRSPYAVSKLAGEHYCQVYTLAYGLACVSLRYFNVFGPRQDPNSRYAAVIPKFIRQLREGTRPQIYGDGQQTRDFTYIDNVVAANLLACKAEDVAGEVFNIAGGAQTTLLDLVQQIAELLRVDITPELRDARRGDVRHSWASIAKARDQLGYVPKVSLRQGLERLIQTQS